VSLFTEAGSFDGNDQINVRILLRPLPRVEPLFSAVPHFSIRRKFKVFRRKSRMTEFKSVLVLHHSITR
jgi:hypothetical protein